MDESLITIIGFIIGGLSIFIYGINLMSDGLKSIAGYHIREYIEKYTSNLFTSILVGTLISAILHSSSAVTVISISLVRAGLMKLEQAIGITIGANIGTCVTSIMIGLNVEQFAYYLVFIGVVIMFLAKKKTIGYIGKVVLGFGLIFVGLQIMSDQMIAFAKEPWFTSIMTTLGKKPWWALLGGTIATGIMQSSTAVIGVVQKLFTTGSITPAAGAAFIFGANIGTCITAVIAALGGSISTKRAAWFHVVYNLAGAIIGMLVLKPFVNLTNWVNLLLNGSQEMYIAQAHFIFNIASTILVIPFVRYCVILLEKLISGNDHHDTLIENIDELDDTLIDKLPVGALAVAKKNTLRMGRNVIANIKLSYTYLISKNSEDYDEIIEIEALIDKYDSRLSKYLLKIAQQPTLAKKQTNEYFKNYQIIKNLERIGDIVSNLANYYKLVYDEKGKFSNEAINDLNKMYKLALEMVQDALDIYEHDNANKLLSSLNKKEHTLNALEIECRQNHLVRMRDGICEDNIAASIIIDIISSIERIGDIALNTANSTITVYKDHKVKYLNV